MNNGNVIHPSCLIEGRVDIGHDNRILANTIILGPTKIGNNNIIGPNAIIGTPGQDTRNPRYDSNESYIEIGDNNIIREFTAIQKPCYREITKVGNNVFLMQSVHIPHDAILQDDVVITPMCVLAGITTVLRGANIGMGSSVHQHSVVGHYTLTAMGSALTKNIRPFTIYVADKHARVNYYAIDKFGFSDLTDEIAKYVLEGALPRSEILLAIAEEFGRLHVNSKRALYK